MVATTATAAEDAEGFRAVKTASGTVCVCAGSCTVKVEGCKSVDSWRSMERAVVVTTAASALGAADAGDSESDEPSTATTAYFARGRNKLNGSGMANEISNREAISRM